MFLLVPALVYHCENCKTMNCFFVRFIFQNHFPETKQEKGVGERGKRGAGGKPVGGGAFPSIGFEIPAPEGLSPRYNAGVRGTPPNGCTTH